MASSDLFFTRRFSEFVPRSEVGNIPAYTRGIYALLKENRRKKTYDVVYIGLAAGPNASIRGRLRIHKRNKSNWTHFTAFEVWPNIPTSVIQELEGIFRHVYRKDSRANKLNVQKKFKKFKGVKINKIQDWPRD